MLLLQGIRHAFREAAMADGGEPGGASEAAPAAKAPVQDRIKAFLFPQESGEAEGDAEADGAEAEAPAQAKQQPKETPKPQVKQAPDPESDTEADTNDIDFTSVTELAERTGLPLDRILDLSVPARIDGKEAKATIREMLKSYQLDGVLNSKLAAHASEVQTWKQQQAEYQAQVQQNMQRLDAGLQVAQRALQGEFNSIDWDALQQSDPAQFAQTLLGFQQRQAMLGQIADQIGQERAQETKRQQEQQAAWLQEQQRMLEAKLPEWADKTAREKAMKEIVEVLGSEVGFSAEEIGRLSDHRDFVVANMALQWLKLQKSKATVMNKVRAAPPLLKPGAAKSAGAATAEAATAARAQLRKSGKVADLAKVLRTSGIV